MSENNGKRLRVGVLVSEYYDEFMREACEGIMRAAEDMDVDLYFITGGYLNASFVDTNKKKYEYQNNAIFDYAVNSGLDILVIYSGPITGGVDDATKKAFLKKFDDIPIITVASEVEDYSSILFGNRSGFAHGVEYLVREHGRKKIGMVSGPATNMDAIERLEAYKEVLAKYDLEFNEEMVVYGTFSEHCDAIVRDLLDKNPDLDAICFANDHMARGGYRVLQERGIKIGKDIAVIGFDDSDFAPLMNPSLTTTKADSRELGYQSLVKACELANEYKENAGEKIIKRYRVDTTLIIRDSCGGRSENMVVDDIALDPTKTELSKLVEAIIYKIYDYNSKNSNLPLLRELITSIIQWMNENVYEKPLNLRVRHEAIQLFKNSLDTILMRTQQVSNAYDLTDYIVDIYMPFVLKEKDKTRLQEAKAEIYRNIQISLERDKNMYLRGNNILNWIMMDITRDTNANGTEDEKYILLLRKMQMLDFNESYILLNPEIMHCESIEDWKKPKQLKIKVMQKGEECQTVAEEDQMLDTDKLFARESKDSERRKTLVVTGLFSTTEQYGLLLVEPTKENLLFIEPIRFQISSALQALSLFSDKEKMTRQLEINLLELQESNAFLDQVSKADELTHIYNRRGFLVTAKKLVRSEENFGKDALFIYADMNNLKLVNDQFGHEEGDYSLRSIAEILKASLGEKAIVGRMGGDEFAAFLLIDEIDKKYITEKVVRDRITCETENLNANNDKPYYVSLSAGIKFFKVEEQSDLDQMMAEADANLYQMKKFKRREILK